MAVVFVFVARVRARGQQLALPPSDVLRMFHFEKLDVYRLSVRFAVLANSIGREIPKGSGHLAEQLRKAASSISFNIAEAVGRYRPSEKTNFHSIARGSAMECAAILNLISALGMGSHEEIERGKHMLERIVAMLTRLCQKTARRRGRGALQ